jgi:hypothetical protein
MNEDVIVPIFLFGGTAAVLWKFFEGHHKERMAMIEKGVNPAEFKSNFRFQIGRGNVLSNLKWGLLLAFVGIGLLLGQQMHYAWGYHEDSAVFGSMLICGGLALIIFYFIAAKKLKNEHPDS